MVSQLKLRKQEDPDEYQLFPYFRQFIIQSRRLSKFTLSERIPRFWALFVSTFSEHREAFGITFPSFRVTDRFHDPARTSPLFSSPVDGHFIGHL
jgi:hypothetical protein